jgi:hypothetical protein
MGVLRAGDQRLAGEGLDEGDERILGRKPSASVRRQGHEKTYVADLFRKCR